MSKVLELRVLAILEAKFNHIHNLRVVENKEMETLRVYVASSDFVGLNVGKCWEKVIDALNEDSELSANYSFIVETRVPACVGILGFKDA